MRFRADEAHEARWDTWFNRLLILGVILSLWLR